MRRIAIGLLASSLLTLVTGAQASGLGSQMERAMAMPSPEKTSRTRRLSSADVAAGLKSALGDAASVAVLELGTAHGFNEHDSALVDVPVWYADRNHAGTRSLLLRSARRTAAEAGPLLREAINDLYLPDPHRVLAIAPCGASDFLRDHAAERLRGALTPIASRSYRDLAGRRGYTTPAIIAPHGDGRLADHIAQHTAHALLRAIARHETRIRREPSARGTPIVARVFGSV